MRVTVEYFGPAREAVGVASETIELDQQFTVAALVRRIAQTHGSRMAGLLLTNGEPSRSLLLAVNEQQVESIERTILSDGDVLSIIPPVSGGECSMK